MLHQAMCTIPNQWWIQTGVTVQKHPIWAKIDDFFCRVTLQFDGWLWKIIGHLFYATSSFVHHFVAIVEFGLELQSGNMLCASFHYHMYIQTGVTVRKRLSWVLTYVTLTFDLWPWPFAWASLLPLVITPENFRMIRWWEHSEKGVTDRRADRQTDRQTGRQTDRRTNGRTEPFIELLGRS